MHTMKQAALQVLMRIVLRLHHATAAGLRWCEEGLNEFAGLDDMVEEILNQKPAPRRPEPPMLIVRVGRPRMH